MAAEDVLALLQQIALAHQQLLKEKVELLKENERLNNLLGDKLSPSPQEASPCNEPEILEDQVSVGHHALDTPRFASNTAFHSSLRGASLGSEPVPATDVDTGSMLKDHGSPSVGNLSASASKADEQWYVGEWLDLTGSFFNGALICVGENYWTTKRQRTPENAKYSMLVDHGANTISLFEHRADGQLRTFQAKPGPIDSDCIIVWVENNQKLRWTLKRHIDGGSTEGLLSRKALDGYALSPKTIQPSGRWIDLIDIRIIKCVMCGIIVCSMCSLGIEIELRFPGRSASAELLDMLLIFNCCALAAFIAEIGVTVAVTGWDVHKQWIMANTFVTVIDAISLIIYIADRQESLLRTCVVLRSLRLLRLARFFKQEGPWKVAWQLVRGLLQSAPTVAAVSVLLILLLYIFACIGLEVLGWSDTFKGKPDIQSRFDGIPCAMLTLFQFVTVEGFSDVYVSLILSEPYLVFYFMPIFLLLSISLMNMVTGVIVESAMDLASEQKEEQRRLLSKKIREEYPIFQEVFAQILGQNAPVVRREEFEVLKPEMLPAFFQDCLTGFHTGSMAEVFDLLDEECDGEITEEQFVTGMLSLHLAVLRQEPCELIAIHKLVRASAIKSGIVTKLVYEMDARQLQFSSDFEELRNSCIAFAHESASRWTSKPCPDPLSTARVAEIAPSKLEEQPTVSKTVPSKIEEKSSSQASSKLEDQLSSKSLHCDALSAQLSQANKRVLELESHVNHDLHTREVLSTQLSQANKRVLQLESHFQLDLKKQFQRACVPSSSRTNSRSSREAEI